MKKLFVVAALLMATTAAHAGNSISFEIEGHKVRIEAPKNCDSLSCIQISAPGLSGSGFGFKDIKSNRFDDEEVAKADPPAQKSTAAPADQAAAPQPSVAPTASSPPASTAVASTSSTPTVSDDVAPSAPPAVAPAAPKPAPVAAAPTTPSASGPPKETRETFASSCAGKISADMPQTPARKFSST
jgi:hypothetical protein